MTPAFERKLSARETGHRSVGFKPVPFAIRAYILGPILSWS